MVANGNIKRIILLCLCVTHGFILHIAAKPVGEPIPDDEGKKYQFNWIFQIANSAVGILYNSLSLYLLLSLDCKLSFYELNIALNVIDLCFTLGRVYFASTYLVHGGLHYGRPFCAVEAGWDITLIVWSCFGKQYRLTSDRLVVTIILLSIVIMGISWVVRNDLCNNVKFTSSQIIRYIVGSFLYSLSLTVLIVGLSGVQLESSGTYCFIPFASHIGMSLAIVAGVCGPICFLVYNAVLTYLSITTAQQLLKELGIQEQAKGRYIHMAKKLVYFFITTMMCYSTAITATLYEWSTGQYFPAGGSLAAGMSAILLSSIVNPSLFFYLNVDLREKFWEKFGAPIYSLLGIKTMEPMKLSLNKLSRRLSSKPAIRRGSSVVPVAPGGESTHSNNTKSESASESSMKGLGSNADFVYWLSHEKLAPVIKEHARKEYVMENFLFYEDAMTYRSKATAFVKTVTKLALQSKENSINSVYASAELQQDWKELETIANRIYTLYIKVCSLTFVIAPWLSLPWCLL
jgi:hypothetical protein